MDGAKGLAKWDEIKGDSSGAGVVVVVAGGGGGSGDTWGWGSCVVEDESGASGDKGG